MPNTPYWSRIARSDRKINVAGMPTAVHYPTPRNLQPAIAHLKKPAGGFPIAETVAKRVMNLPMPPTITTAQQDKTVVSLLLG